MSADEANRWLMGSGVPSCSFPEIGAKHEGYIAAVEMGQQRDPKDNSPKVWDDGSPMMQMIITLNTNERDPQIENDNGVRKLYVASKGMREALAAAVKLTGAGGVAIGGWLGMKFIREGERTNRAFNPPKEYAARYEPPTVSVDDDGYGEPATQSATPPAPQPEPAPAQNTPDLSGYSSEPF